MELDDLIVLVQELGHLIGEADMAADAGAVDEAMEQLRKAKELLEAEFLAE